MSGFSLSKDYDIVRRHGLGGALSISYPYQRQTPPKAQEVIILNIILEHLQGTGEQDKQRTRGIKDDNASL